MGTGGITQVLLEAIVTSCHPEEGNTDSWSRLLVIRPTRLQKTLCLSFRFVSGSSSCVIETFPCNYRKGLITFRALCNNDVLWIIGIDLQHKKWEFKYFIKRNKTNYQTARKRRSNAVDIRLINLYLKNKVTLQFVTKTVKFDGNSFQLKAAYQKILELERKRHHRNLCEIGLALYGLHLILVKHLGHIFWENFEELANFHTKMNKKTSKLKKKLNKLIGNPN